MAANKPERITTVLEDMINRRNDRYGKFKAKGMEWNLMTVKMKESESVTKGMEELAIQLVRTECWMQGNE
jgi:hypothetical protein